MANPLRELIGKARYEKNDRSYVDVDRYLRFHNEHIADLIDAAQDVVSKESNMPYSEISDDCVDMRYALSKLTEGK